MSLLVSVCWAPLITLQMYQLPPSNCAISKSLYFRETVKEHKNPRKATASSDGIGSIHCCPAQSGTAGFHPQHTHSCLHAYNKPIESRGVFERGAFMKMKGPRRFHPSWHAPAKTHKPSARQRDECIGLQVSPSSASCSRGTKSNEKTVNRRTVTCCLASLGERG